MRTTSLCGDCGLRVAVCAQDGHLTIDYDLGEWTRLCRHSELEGATSCGGVILGLVSELFEKHFHRNRSLDDIHELDDLLPDNLHIIRGLSLRCLEESRKAFRAGQHTEGRRLDVLARQLHYRAAQISRSTGP